MAPEYDELFEWYKDKRADMIIARLEGSLNEDISMRYGIYSFPRVVLFKPGDFTISAVFDGKRILHEFIAWVESHAPSVDEEEFIPELEDEDSPVDILAIGNLTEVTDELDFFKREMITMKDKIELLEKELKSLQNNHSSIAPSVSIFYVIILVGSILLIIAAILTLIRLYKKRGRILQVDHPHKV